MEELRSLLNECIVQSLMEVVKERTAESTEEFLVRHRSKAEIIMNRHVEEEEHHRILLLKCRDPRGRSIFCRRRSRRIVLDLVEVIERVVLEDVRNVVGMRQDGLQGDQGELT